MTNGWENSVFIRPIREPKSLRIYGKDEFRMLNLLIEIKLIY